MAVTQTQVAVAGQHQDLPVMRIDSRRAWMALNLPELWEYRELPHFFVSRDIKGRYMQTVIGAAWAVLQRALSMIVFSSFFGQICEPIFDQINPRV